MTSWPRVWRPGGSPIAVIASVTSTRPEGTHRQEDGRWCQHKGKLLLPNTTTTTTTTTMISTAYWAKEVRGKKSCSMTYKIQNNHKKIHNFHKRMQNVHKETQQTKKNKIEANIFWLIDTKTKKCKTTRKRCFTNHKETTIIKTQKATQRCTLSTKRYKIIIHNT